MKSMEPQTQRDPGLVGALREIASSTGALVQSEIKLAKAEAAHNAKVIAQHSSALITGAVFAWLGAQCLLAFAILALGALFGGAYWLSALVVGLALVIPGARWILKAVKAFKRIQLSPTAVQGLRNDTALIEEAIKDNITHLRREKAS